MLLNHIAIIVSSEEGISFYKSLGFVEKKRTVREGLNHDEIVILDGCCCTLEIYKDETHPARVTNPEAYGLRHLCFQIEDISTISTSESIRVDGEGHRYTFIKDPDGLPIEIKEIKPTAPVGEYSFEAGV